MEKQGHLPEDTAGREDNTGAHIGDETLHIPNAYGNESQHLKNVLSAVGLGRVCIQAEQRVTSCRSALINEAVKELEPFLEAKKFLGSSSNKQNLKEAFFVGSSAEGIKIDVFQRPQSSGDTDGIILLHHFIILEPESYALSATLNEPHIILTEDQNNPGYVKLKIPPLLADKGEYQMYSEKSNGEVYLSSTKFVGTWEKFISTFTSPCNITIHGPAVTVNLDRGTTEMFLSAFLGQGADCPPSVTSSQKKYSIDIVICHYYSGWPHQAGDWITRQTRSNWPSKELKERCVEKGCILAPVGPKDGLDKDVFWRISFNQAEQLLIESFNETQLHCLILLKFLKEESMKAISGKNITSYILKTTIFWCMSEVDEGEWRPENLIHCVLKCLEKMRRWLSAGFMPNYFIETRNMFVQSELTDEIACQLISVLDRIISNPWQEIKSISPLKARIQNEDKQLALQGVCMDIKRCISVTTNIAVGHLLCHRTGKPQEAPSKRVPDFREVFIKRFIWAMYDVTSSDKFGVRQHGDYLGQISTHLDQEGPHMSRKFFELRRLVDGDNRFQILSKYRQILVDNLDKDDLRRTIEALRSTAEDDELRRAFVDYLTDLDNISSNM